MSQPPFPSLLTSFTAFQQSQGNNSFPGTQVDAQFNQINSILTAVIGNLSLIQRADNKLASGSVGLDQVGPDVLGYIVAAAASGGAPPSNVSPSLVPSGRNDPLAVGERQYPVWIHNRERCRRISTDARELVCRANVSWCRHDDDRRVEPGDEFRVSEFCQRCERYVCRGFGYPGGHDGSVGGGNDGSDAQ